MKINRLVLASTSKYRRALLQQVGLIMEPMQPSCDEESISAAQPIDLARKRSEAKGLSLALSNKGFLALSADQVLEFQGKSYGKAADREEAALRLQTFAGHSHALHSAYTLVLYPPSQQAPRILQSRVVTASMRMRSLTPEEIHAYLDSQEWEGCAGCYQYENRGMQLFDSAQGDMTTIIGMPIPELLRDLRALGINPLLSAPWTLQLPF